MNKNFYKLSSLLLLLGGCASDPQSRGPSSEERAALLPDTTVAKKEAAALAGSPATATPLATSAHAAAPSAAHAVEVAPVPAATAFQWLKNGNLRYRSNNLRRDGQSKADRTRLSKGQHPHTIVVACSDSRVPPEVVFDQKLGEIFVVRTAGEALDYSAIASIEYAIEHLGSQLIVVMGHESCGAVKAAIQTPPGQSAGSVNLDRLVENIRPRIQGVARSPASENVVPESNANAKGAADELLKSEIIKKHIGEGKLSIKSGVYRLESGEVVFN